MGQPTWQNSLLGSADQIGAGGIARALLGAADQAQAAIPPVWSGDYSDSQKAEWEYALAQSPETQKKHEQFRARAMPILLRELPQFPMEITPDEAIQIAGNVLGGFSDDPRTQQLTMAFLNHVRDKAEAIDSSVTPEQFAAWEADPNVRNALNANYRLTDKGQEKQRLLADYNILRTFQTSPEHRPVHLSSAPANAVFSGIGAPFDTSGMGAAQLSQIATGTPESALDNTLMNDQYFQERMKVQPEFWNDAFGGAALPQNSAMNLEGLGRKTVDGDSWLGRTTRWLTGPVFRGGTEQQRQDYADSMRQLNRFTPIKPKDLPPEVAKGFTARAEAVEADDQTAPATYLPQGINAINDRFGTNIPAFYPSSFANDAIMAVPNIALDPGNMAYTVPAAAAGLYAGGIPGLLGVLASNAMDIGPETAFNTGLSFTNTPQTVKQYFLSPTTNLPDALKDKTGKPIDPADRKGYEAGIKKLDERNKDLLGEAGLLQDVMYPDRNKKPEMFRPSLGRPQNWGAAPSIFTK